MTAEPTVDAKAREHDVGQASFDSSFSSDSAEEETLGDNAKSGNVPGLSRQNAFVDQDAGPSCATPIEAKPKNEIPVTWMSLPRKGQLAVLTIARLSEPLSERSLAAYMFYQLRWFDSTAPDSKIASQGGVLTAAFAAAQFFTAVWWGRAADTPWIGRKRVLLVGLTGTAIASIGVGFSKTFYSALFFRALAGALNGNIGVMRTMMSEIIQEKKYQSRAFLLLPMCFNIGVVIGPILGGFLANPIKGFPDTFGPGSKLGGKDGVEWMNMFPYALPNLFSGIFILISAMAVVFGLDETHEALKYKPDRGRQIGQTIWGLLRGRKPGDQGYSQVATDETEMTPNHSTQVSAAEGVVFPRSVDPEQQRAQPLLKQQNSKTGFRSILTKNVVLTLIAHHSLALHVSSFNALIFLLLPAPYSQNKDYHFPSLRWSGGLGMSQQHVGFAMAIIGIIGLPVQLIFYPPLNARLGTLPGYRLFLPFSILAYTCMPFLVLLPEKPAWFMWVLLSFVLASQVLSRTFALTGTVLLVNNSSPSPAYLGAVHGFAQSVSSLARMLGPTVGGWILGYGLQHRFVGLVWWLMGGVALLNWLLLFTVYEGDGKGGRS